MLALSTLEATTASAANTVQDFGQIAVGASTIATVAIPLTGAQVAAGPTISLKWNLDFSASGCTPNANGCSIQVTFTPKAPGLLEDAVIVKDPSGAVLAEAFLHGIGLGAQVAFAPGALQQPQWNIPFQDDHFTPGGVAVDRAGFVYVSDTFSKVKRVDPANTVMTIYAGSPAPPPNNPSNSGDGGPATAASLNQPTALAVNAAGDLYIDSSDVIRKVDGVTGIITTVAGGGTNSTGEGILPTSAQLNGVAGLAVNAAGDLYICESYAARIRKVSADTGLITTVVGNRAAGVYGDGGPALTAYLGQPSSIALDASGNLYVSDEQTYVIRMVTAASGIINTVAGVPYQGANPTNAAPTNDGQPATSAELYQPRGLAVDSAGNLYFGDGGFIRKVSAATSLISTIAGGDSSLIAVTATTPLDGYPATSVRVWGSVLAIDVNGNLYGRDYEVLAGSTSILFAQTAVGQNSAPQTLSFANIGNQPLLLTQVQLGLNFSRQASGATDCSGSGTISAGGSCTVAIAFAPSQENAPSSSLTFTDNSLSQPGSQQTARLSGPFGQVVLSQNAAVFAATSVGEGSSPASIRVSNTGDTSLTVSAALVGAESADFSLADNTCAAYGTNSATLTAQTSCGFWVLFQPTATGTRTASVAITDSVDANPLSITLSGTATQPQVTLNPNPVVFPLQLVGGFITESLTVTNTGTGTMQLTGASVTSSSNIFYVYPNYAPGFCGYGNGSYFFLAPGASCILQVSFAPFSSGQFSGTLSLSGNFLNAPINVALTGSAVYASPLYAISSDFGSQRVLTLSSVQNVIVSNVSAAPLNDISASVTGANAADFLQVSACPATLAVGATCNVSVVFYPQMMGSRTASLTLASSGGTASFPLSGTGVLTGKFEIVNSLTGKVLDLNGASTSDGAAVQQNALSGLAEQQWTFVPVDATNYKIVNALSSKVLDVTGESTANGALLQEWDDLGGANQQWQLVAVDDVHYKILNRLSGKVLDLEGGSTANGTSIQQWDYLGDPQQLWVLVPAVPYSIANTLSANALDITGESTADGTSIQQSSVTGAKQQQWQFLPVGSGYYAVLDVATGKALDVRGESTADGASIQQWDYLGGQNQQWQLIPVSTLAATASSTPPIVQPTFNFEIVNRLSGKVLDDTASSTSSGTAIQQWRYLGGANQQWQLNPLIPYVITNAASGDALDVIGGATTNGTNIQQWSPNGLAQQQWQIVPVGGGYYEILNELTAKALEVTGSSTANGALIDQSDVTAAANQLWQITIAGNLPGDFSATPLYSIVNKQSGKVLDDTGSSLMNGTLIQQWTSLGTSNQLWSFQRSNN